MKLIVKLLCGTGTALVILLGFALPRIVSGQEDRRLLDRTVVYETEPVRFHSARQITDTLSLLSQECSMMNLESTYARMSEEQANAAWRDFFHRMADGGLFSGDTDRFASASTVPVLYFVNSMRTERSGDAVSEAASPFSDKVSAVLWSCALTDPDGASAQVLLDDATGLVVSVSYWPGNAPSEILSTAEKRAALNTFSKGCAALFAAYYGLEIDKVQYGDYPDSATITLRTENDRTYPLQMTLQGVSFSIWAK